ncbi:hypothetical protein LCGC14_1344690 [marine sediment metagenome]|uniref:Uncharacterized protein n=1 Tax=marine sediment metagenome TaxID=412755 RepID=A0A0F9KDC8_9ZZZZ
MRGIQIKIDVKCSADGCENKARKRARIFGLDKSQNITKEIFIQNFCKNHFKQIRKCDNFIEELNM